MTGKEGSSPNGPSRTEESMRRLLVTLAAMSVVASFAPGQAAGQIAECKGTAGPNGFPPQVSGNCVALFKLAQARSVTLTLNPGLGFTGTLHAQITGPGFGQSLQGVYAGGVLVDGAGSMTIPMPAGNDWKLSVVTQGVIQSPYTIPGFPGSQQGPNIAYGAFSATVTAASTGEPVT